MRFYAAYWRSNIPIHFVEMAVRRRKFFHEKADFVTLIGCHGNVPSVIAK